MIVKAPLKSGKICSRDRDFFVDYLDRDYKEGTVLFVDASKLRTPADFLNLCDVISQTEPQTGKELMIDSLAKLTIASSNSQTWMKIFDQELAIKDVPEELQQLHKVIQELARGVFETTSEIIKRLSKQLASSKDTNDFLSIEVIANRVKKEGFFRVVDEDKKRKQVKRLIERFKRRWTAEKRGDKKLQRVPAMIAEAFSPIVSVFGIETSDSIEQKDEMRPQQTANELRAIDISRLESLVYKSNAELDELLGFVELIENDLLERDSDERLLTALLKRGQRILLQTMPATYAMREKYYSLNGPPLASLDGFSVSRWLQWYMEESSVGKEFNEALVYLKAINMEVSSLKPEELQQLNKEDERLQSIIQSCVKKFSYSDNFSIFPSHPFFNDDNWLVITQEILKISDRKVRVKLLRLYEARRKVALIQADITNTMIEVTGDRSQGFLGGLRGWNDKRDSAPLTDAAPSTQVMLKEANCVGRSILLSGMLLESGTYDLNTIRGGNSIHHVLLGTRDYLGVSRMVEPSGGRHLSYYGVSLKGFELAGKYSDSTVIAWNNVYRTMVSGLLASYSFYTNKNRLHLGYLALKISDTDQSWYNFAIQLSMVGSDYDRLLSFTRAASISNHPKMYEKILIRAFNDYFITIKSDIAEGIYNPLLPWIKLSLLEMRNNLQNHKLTKLFDKKSDKALKNGRSTSQHIESMAGKLNLIIDLLSEVDLPTELDPTKFLTPNFNSDGNLEWVTPDKEIITSL